MNLPKKMVWLLFAGFLLSGSAAAQAADMNAQNQKTAEEKTKEEKAKMKILEAQLNSAHAANQVSKLKSISNLQRIPKVVAVVPASRGSSVSASASVPKKS